MLYSVSSTLRFDASHSIPAHPLCSRTHGHTWTVTAHVSHEEMDHGLPRGGDDLQGWLRLIVDELDNRDLDVMLPFRSYPTSVAAWFFERLSAQFPGLTRVEVCHRHEGGSVSRI